MTSRHARCVASLIAAPWPKVSRLLPAGALVPSSRRTCSKRSPSKTEGFGASAPPVPACWRAAPPNQRLKLGEIMRLCGWETRSMFDGYNIIDEADLASAVAKRFNGKVTAKSEGFAEQPS